MKSGLSRALLLFLALGMSLASAFAADAAPGAGRTFATVSRVAGNVQVVRKDGGETPLRAGDAVLVGDKVVAAAQSEALLMTADAGMVAVRPGTEFIAEAFAAEGKRTDKFLVRLVTGSLRIVSGWIASLNPGEHKVMTRVATIGIRGTDHEPYVLATPTATGYAVGTYDKVNRGGTTLSQGDNNLDIDPGKVGFARAADPSAKTRALMTLLLPVLLDKVPDFYVPGQFEDEIEKYSKIADTVSRAQLEKKRAGGDAAERCNAESIAQTWLNALDKGIEDRNAEAVLALFAPEVSVRANVRDQDGNMVSVSMSREEVVRSTFSALSDLQNYRQRRIGLDAQPSAEDAGCRRIVVKSTAIEQGTIGGKPYRFEALEEYLLQQRDRAWLAVEAATTQH